MIEIFLAHFVFMFFSIFLYVSYAIIPEKLEKRSIKTGKQFLLNLIPYYTLVVSIVETYKSFVIFEKLKREHKEKYGNN